jgi:hypothetical protein
LTWSHDVVNIPNIWFSLKKSFWINVHIPHDNEI